MTKAEILVAVRYLIRELSTETGAVLDDAANLLDYAHDATEKVVLDLMPFMPEQFMTTENITLIANQANYTLTNEYWMIYKVEKNVTNESPQELEIIEPLQFQYETNVGETEESPGCVYFMGSTIYFVKTPSTAKANYAKVYGIRPEAFALPTAGPTYIPRMAHRLVVYKAAELCCVTLDADPSKFQKLYNERMGSVLRLWSQRYISQVRYVKEGLYQRMVVDARDRVLYDTDWP